MSIWKQNQIKKSKESRNGEIENSVYFVISLAGLFAFLFI